MIAFPRELIKEVIVGNPAAVDISAVITLYNEEANVEPLTRHLIAAFRERFAGRSFELILVLNGPLDGTPAIAERLAREIPELTLVAVSPNQGYGGGIQAGLTVARGSVVGFLCGDEQVDSADVARVFDVAASGAHELVKVTRAVRQDGFERLLVTRIYNLLFRLMFGGVSSDVNGTPKVLKREALERMNLTAKDWFLDAQVMIQAGKLGMSVEEIPVVFKRRERGASNVRLKTLLEFLKNMWKYRHGKV